MTNYDVLAQYYDEIMGDRQDEVNHIINLIDRYNPKAKSLLELGSGTGSILVGLSSRFEVSGIEKSPEMLKLSQLKLPKSTFLLGDMAAVSTSRKYDVIICIFDSINHLPNFGAWQEMFQNAAAHLNTGGIFIFDMITTGRVAKLAHMPYYTQSTPSFTANMQIEARAKDSVEWTTTIEVPLGDGTIDVYEDYAVETAFGLEQVTNALKHRFAILDCFERFNATPTDDSDRIYFVCR